VLKSAGLELAGSSAAGWRLGGEPERNMTLTLRALLLCDIRDTAELFPNTALLIFSTRRQTNLMVSEHQAGKWVSAEFREKHEPVRILLLL